MLATLVLLGIGALPVRAASAVEIEGRALVGGSYAIGGWSAIAVTLVNEGSPTSGHLEADTEAGTTRRFVEMPAGSRKAVTIYVQPGGFQREVAIRYVEPNGTVRTTVAVRAREQSSHQVAIVGDRNGSLRAQLSLATVPGASEPVVLATRDLPERPEPLEGIDTIVWAGDATTLAEAQRRSLERWLAGGGHLIVIGGADWQSRADAFSDLLPLEGLAASDEVAQAELAAWVGADPGGVAPATVATGTPRPDARVLVAAGETPLISMRPIGAGRVLLLGPDLAADAYRGWPGSPQLWSRLLPSTMVIDAFFGGQLPDREQAAGSMAQALNTLPALEVPPAELLLLVIVAYIVLIGPVSYLVLSRLDRRELAWVTAPVLVLLFTAGSYGIGVTLKGSDVLVNQITVIRTAAGVRAATVESYAGVFSPTRGTYDLAVEADALLAQMRGTAFAEPGVQPASPLTVEQGQPARLRQLPIASGGFEYVRADGIADVAPALEVAWSTEGTERGGTVTNLSDEPILDVAYVATTGGARIGDIGPGETVEFTVPPINVNATSASDQIYGFGGFDSSDPERRRIAARRGVIDALVGMGAGMPAGGSELAGLGGRGPYIIGWRAGEGPMPILVDGADTQRYAEVVEVVSIGSGMARGTVVIGPAQMGLGVVTDGAMTPVGPGMVALGTGSATFGIALPLEATALAPTDMEIIAVPDPSMLIGDSGDFGGAWPAGAVVELRDARSGEWTVLGDLGDASRFSVDDPEAAIGPNGRIEVRVRADELDPNIGENSVIMSARVEGVIRE